MGSADESREERVAANEATFRRANEALYGRFRELEVDGKAPFLCECADERCTQTIRLTLEEFEEVRDRQGVFFVIPGHAILEAERVIEDADRYELVQKPTQI
jgi:hypothetical protein